MHLFAYGSLMVPEIMRAVSGDDFPSARALLGEFRRGRVQGEDFPGILPCPAESVSGVLYHDLSDRAWQRLDRFEGALYRRQAVVVDIVGRGLVSAETYVIAPAYAQLLTKEEWQFEAFLPRWSAWLAERFDTHGPE